MKDLKAEVIKIIKSNMWMIISTVDEKNHPHSSVVVYQSDGEVLIFQTGMNTIKAAAYDEHAKELARKFVLDLNRCPEPSPRFFHRV